MENSKFCMDVSYYGNQDGSLCTQLMHLHCTCIINTNVETVCMISNQLLLHGHGHIYLYITCSVVY